jgi:hypothetical protein
VKADTTNLKSLFQKDVRYVIPVFQRPYVWNQEEQWEPLWEDVRNAAERFIDELELTDGDPALAEKNAGSHFMGAVVVQQVPTTATETETRTVIDGQQRMTTVQLLADAAQEVFEELDFGSEANRMSRLVLNAYASGDEAFKLWPTSLDQDAFRAAMTNHASPEGFEDSLIVQAHDFFRLQIREWIEHAEEREQMQHLIHGLETAIFGLLEVVVIDLSSSDDAFVIFETLNARGTPLLASDLIKNYLLQTAAGLELDHESLYESSWKPLEDKWWRKEIRQGRIYRPRLDQFLNYWLVMMTADEVKTHDVFPEFRRYAETVGAKPDELVATIHDHAKVFRSLDTFDPHGRIGTFMYRWRTIDAGTSTPLLLWLMSRPTGALPVIERDRCLVALESYLVRRMVCRLTTKDYNRLFLELLSRLHGAAPGEVGNMLVAYLSGQQAESRRWPSDEDLRHAMIDLPLYRLLTRGRLRLILEAVEDDLRSDLSEESHVQRGKLTIEHVMPQSWKEHWLLDTVEDPLDAELRRERTLHSIGNLTLVNGKLNPSLSNREWPTKSQLLADHTVLHLNKRLLKEYGAVEWSEATIRNRAESLWEHAKRIWPPPLHHSEHGTA